MNNFYENLLTAAATIDELLSDAFEASVGQKVNSDKAALRLAAWCRASSSGDWALFSRRLKRDGLTIDLVLERFATSSRKKSAPPPLWWKDAKWIDNALRNENSMKCRVQFKGAEDYPFKELFVGVVNESMSKLTMHFSDTELNIFSEESLACLQLSLMNQLTELCAPILYNKFRVSFKVVAAENPANYPESSKGNVQYLNFIGGMRENGFQELFEEKPVLLRLIAVITRQWINSSTDFVTRLIQDLQVIQKRILNTVGNIRVKNIEDGISDHHNFGYSVLIITREFKYEVQRVT